MEEQRQVEQADAAGVQVLDDVGAAGALDGRDRVAVAQGVADVVQVAYRTFGAIVDGRFSVNSSWFRSFDSM